MFWCYSYTIIKERINSCLLKLQLLKQSIKMHWYVVNTVVVWLHILGLFLVHTEQYYCKYYSIFISVVHRLLVGKEVSNAL